MNYALISSALEVIEYPSSPAALLPHVSFPANWSGGFIEGNLFVAIQEVERPIPTGAQVVLESAPLFIDGVWQQQYYLGALDKPTIRDRIADIRWHKERAGITYKGIGFNTDDVSQTKYLAILMAVMQNPAFTVNWKTTTGFATLHAAEIVGLTQAVQYYVQTCFDVEKAKADALEAQNDPNIWALMDIEAGWPTGVFE